jgi:F0F1-type ATP synthase membrane subunit b/b'
MLGLGDSVLSAVLRIAGSVAVLAAVYFFILKPVLHTAEKGIHQANHSQNQAFRQSQQTQRQVQRTVRRAERQANQAVKQAGLQAHRATVRVQRQVRKAAKGGQANTSGLPKSAQRVIKCVQHANGDVTKLERCQ